MPLLFIHTGGNRMDQNEQTTTIQTDESSENRVSEARRSYAYALLNITIFWVITVILQVTLKHLIPKDAPAYASALVNFVPMYLIAFPIYLVISKRLPASPPEQHRMNIGQILLTFPCCECIAIAGNFVGIIINLILTLLLGIRTDSTMLAQGLFGESTFVFVIAAVICAPIVEEMIFRKILIDRVRKYGELPAILISGIMFGMFHGNFTQFFYAAALGLLFAWVYIRTGKVIHTIIMHFMINFWGSAMPLILLHRIDKDIIIELLVNQNYALLTENIGQFVPFVVLILCNYFLALAGLILFIVFRKRIVVKPAEEEIPKKKRFFAAVLNYGFLALFAACAAEFVMQIIANFKK